MKPLILTLIALYVATSATAYDAIDDQRRVDIYSTGGNSTATPAAPFADFNTSGQNTFFGSDGFRGTLSGYGESDFDFFVRVAIFDVTFAFAQREPFEIIGSATGNGGNFGLATCGSRIFMRRGEGSNGGGRAQPES